VATLNDTIATVAAQPASSSNDGQSASAHPLAALNATANRLAQVAAVKKRRRGISFTKLVTPGALPDNGRAGAFDSPSYY